MTISTHQYSKVRLVLEKNEVPEHVHNYIA